MTVARQRPDGKRSLLWIYLIVMLVTVLPFFGESAIGYNYVRTRFGWDLVKYSEFRTITEVVDLAGQAIFIPLLGYAQVGKNMILFKGIESQDWEGLLMVFLIDIKFQILQHEVYFLKVSNIFKI
jgi:hypothetical protein